MVNLFKSPYLEKNFLSRPFQLALDFIIVLYGEHFSGLACLTLI